MTLDLQCNRKSDFLLDLRYSQTSKRANLSAFNTQIENGVLKSHLLEVVKSMSMKITMDRSRMTSLPIFQMHWLLIFGLIQCMITATLLKTRTYTTSDSIVATYQRDSKETSKAPFNLAYDFDLLYNASLHDAYMPPVADITPDALEGEKSKKEANFLAYQIKKNEPLYIPIIVRAANRHNVDPAMVKAIIMAESGFNPKAISRVGARGLMQLMPATARSLGVKNIFNPEENINAGVKYFKALLNRFDGKAKLALAAYNAGSKKVRKYRGVPPFKATRRYIKKVMEYHQFYTNGPVGTV